MSNTPPVVTTFDIEAKADNTDKLGFTRPFLVTLITPADEQFRFYTFHNTPSADRRPAWRYRHLLARRGCVDRFMRHVLGHGAKRPTGADRRRYQADQVRLQAERGSSFKLVFLIQWLHRHRKEYRFTIVSRQSEIGEIKVWRKGERPSHHWIFFGQLNRPVKKKARS